MRLAKHEVETLRLRIDLAFLHKTETLEITPQQMSDILDDLADVDAQEQEIHDLTANLDDMGDCAGELKEKVKTLKEEKAELELEIEKLTTALDDGDPEDAKWVA